MKDRIKELRKANHMTQTELGQKLGVVKQTVCAWEKGINYPNADILTHMSLIFGVPLDYLMGRTSSIEGIPIKSQSETSLSINEQKILGLLKSCEDQRQLIRMVEKFCSLDEDGRDVILGKIIELSFSNNKRVQPTGTEGALGK